MHFMYRCGDRHVAFELERRDDGGFRVVLDGRAREVEAELLAGSTLHLNIDGQGRSIRLVRHGAGYQVAVDGAVFTVMPDAGVAEDAETHVLATPAVVAPMPGTVLKVLVRKGQTVDTGDTLLILEAMKMETRIDSEAPAVVQRVLVSEGQTVDAGAVLVELSGVNSSPVKPVTSNQ
jgi:biotin carboxyl carrier protein